MRDSTCLRSCGAKLFRVEEISQTFNGLTVTNKPYDHTKAPMGPLGGRQTPRSRTIAHNKKVLARRLNGFRDDPEAGMRWSRPNAQDGRGRIWIEGAIRCCSMRRRCSGLPITCLS